MKRINEKLTSLETEQLIFEKQLEEAENKQATVLKDESRIKQLVDGNYQLIDTRRKAYIDAIRVNASNISRNINDKFRESYDNYRDDHHYLRLLSRANGIIITSDLEVTIKLWLPGTLQKHIVKNMQIFTDKLVHRLNENQDVKKLNIELLTGAISSW